MTGRQPAGIVLILVGAIFLLGQLDWLDARGVLATWWPSLLILVGIIQIAQRFWRTGVLWIAAGAFLLSITLDFLSWESLAVVWPLALVVLGAWLIFFRGSGRGVPVSTDEQMRHFIVLGSLETRNESRSLEGGEVTALLGSRRAPLCSGRAPRLKRRRRR